MNELSRSGIMRFSKAVLAESISTSGFEHQTEALREKHLGLITRLKTPEATAFDLAEFHRLFPNDEELPALIAAFGAKNSSQLGQRRKLAGAVSAITLLGIAAALSFRSCDDRATRSHITQASPPQVAIPVATPATAPVAAATPKPAPEKGTLSFEVPDDVSVYVRNELVPRDKLRRYRIAPGQYPMRIEKEGFLPIEGQVDVKAGRVSVIRAGGAQ